MITYLVSSGLAATYFNAYRPPERVARALIVTPYGGSESDYTQDDAEERIDNPRFQIECMDTDGAIAEALAVNAANRIAKIRNQTINGTWYLRAYCVSPPAFLQRDELARISYVASFEASKAIDEIAEGS